MGAVIIGCVVYGIQLGWGVRGLWVSMFDVFWVLFGVVVLGGGFFGPRFPLCVCVRARAWLGTFGVSTSPLVFLHKTGTTHLRTGLAILF